MTEPLCAKAMAIGKSSAPARHWDGLAITQDICKRLFVDLEIKTSLDHAYASGDVALRAAPVSH